MEFEVVDGSDQVETQAKAFTPIAIAVAQNMKNLQSSDNMFAEDALAGQFAIGAFCSGVSGWSFDFFAGIWLLVCSLVRPR